MNEDMRTLYFERRERIIKEHGWMVQAVFPSAEDPDDCSFQYTIGLHDRALPELVSTGLPPEVGQAILNDVVEAISQRVAAGLPLLGKLELEDWSTPFYLMPAEADKAEELAMGACQRSQGQATYLQVCWPSQDGVFPWEPGASEDFREAQPLLGLPQFLN